MEPRFFDNLPGDSLDRVELIMALEEAFDVEIPDEDAKKFRTVQDAIDYVQTQERRGSKLTRRVVVTGLGLICGVGNSTDEVWKGVLAGKSGVARITGFDASATSPARSPPRSGTSTR